MWWWLPSCPLSGRLVLPRRIICADPLPGGDFRQRVRPLVVELLGELPELLLCRLDGPPLDLLAVRVAHALADPDAVDDWDTDAINNANADGIAVAISHDHLDAFAKRECYRNAVCNTERFLCRDAFRHAERVVDRDSVCHSERNVIRYAIGFAKFVDFRDTLRYSDRDFSRDSLEHFERVSYRYAIRHTNVVVSAVAVWLARRVAIVNCYSICHAE